MRRIIGATVVIGGAILGSQFAAAADLGGNCCADLEERIAELEATTARKGNRKVSLTVYGDLNEAVMFWDDGTESNAYVTTQKTTPTIFGFEGNAGFVPGWTAGFRLEVEIDSASSDTINQISDDRGSFGLIGLPSQTPLGTGLPLSLRHAQWYIESKVHGRVTVGQQSQATDGIAEIDLSGSTAVSLSSVETWNEGFLLRDKNNGQQIFPGFAAVGIYGEIFRGNLDGGRANLVRYDSPAVGGFIVSAAWGEDDDWDVALRYFTDNPTFEFRAGIGYRDGVTLDTDNFSSALFAGSISIFDPPTSSLGEINNKNIVGSASVLHKPTGLFLTAAGGERDWDDNVPFPVSTSAASGTLSLTSERYFYIKSGVFKQFFPLGKTSIYGEYYHIDNVGYRAAFDFGVPSQVSNTNDASVWGVGVVQHIDAAAAEIYLAYRHYDAGTLNDPLAGGGDPNIGAFGFAGSAQVEMDIVMSGMRIRF